MFSVSTNESAANITTTNEANQSNQRVENEQKIYSRLTYIPSISESITWKIKECCPNVTLAPKPPCKVNNFFTKTKTQLPIGRQSGCVYQLECNQCDKIYIGQTTQLVSKRMEQHEYDCKCDINKPLTALAVHSKRKKHTFNFEEVSILKKENNVKR